MRIYANEEYLLGNATLHLQLSTALAIMGHLICNSSRPQTAAQLAESLELSVRYLRKQLRLLSAGKLVQPHRQVSDAWICTRPSHTISLADVYRCLLAEAPASGDPITAGTPPSSADILMMQATVTVNQLVLQQLQQFDLGRLKIAESALLFSAALREKAGRLRCVPEAADSDDSSLAPSASNYSAAA
jgi:DNA-binding IscR family transcriptional regulator